MRLSLSFTSYGQRVRYISKTAFSDYDRDREPKFYGVALMGLFFISFGIIMLFAFIIRTAGGQLPDILEFRTESYSILLIGLVNIAAAIGLLYRTKAMWSVTMIFVAVIMIGDLMDIFFTGNTKITVFILYLAVLLYMMTREVRMWYNIV